MIHWWWADPKAPWATRHSFGSNNWCHPNCTSGGLGEIPEIKPVWRDGSRPANACGGLVVPDCRNNPLPQPMLGTLTLAGVEHDVEFVYEPNADRWEAFWNVPWVNCQSFDAVVECLPVPGDPNGAHRWQLAVSAYLTTGIPNPITMFFDAPPPGQPLDVTLDISNLQLQCGLLAGPATVRVTADPIGGR